MHYKRFKETDIGSFNRLPKHIKLKRTGEGGFRLKRKRLKSKSPLVSIITVTFNSEKYLEDTIKSIQNLSIKDFEHIIIDGGSKDNTLKIIRKYSKKISYWVSETDRGIYDAFNKGLLVAKGKYIGFVNSDDLLTKKSLFILSKYIKKFPDLDFFFGSVKKHWGVLHGFKPWKIFFSLSFYTSHSTGFYIKKSSAKKMGFYNLNYKYLSDFDYLYRMIVHMKMKGMASKKKELFGHFRRGGFSSKVKFKDHLLEDYNIRIKNKQNKFFVTLVSIYKIIKNYKRL
jgi:glycosyltransferase involved in cell wall biosynthesis